MEKFDFIKTGGCEQDYVERGGSCEELTVTITLAEYREAVSGIMAQAAEIAHLTEERDRFKRLAQAYGDALRAQHPEVMQSVAASLVYILGGDNAEEDAAADDEED